MQVWKEVEECWPTREEVKTRVVFVKNKDGEIRSTKVHPSEWKSCGFSAWTFADELLGQRA